MVTLRLAILDFYSSLKRLSADLLPKTLGYEDEADSFIFAAYLFFIILIGFLIFLWSSPAYATPYAWPAALLPSPQKDFLYKGPVNLRPSTSIPFSVLVTFFEEVSTSSSETFSPKQKIKVRILNSPYHSNFSQNEPKVGSTNGTSSLWIPRDEEEAMKSRPLVNGKIVFTPGSGLTISTDDKRFSLKLSAWAQLRLTVNHNQSPPIDTPNPTITLEFNRARLLFAGNVFSQDIHYMLHLMFAPKDLGFKNGVATRPPIFMWYTSYTRLKNANIQAGFFFVPHARQRMQPAPLWQFPDNSTASYEFTLNQDMGIQISSPDVGGLGRMRYYAGVFIGDGYDWYKANDTGFTYLARFEVLPMGMFQDYSEADFERLRRPKLSIGLAYGFSDRDHQTRQISGTTFADGGTMSSHNITADVVLKWAGVSFLGDFYIRKGWRHPGVLKDMNGVPISTQTARNGLGWTTQLGVLMPYTRFELVGRYAGIRPLKSVDTSLARLDEAGGGMNYYFFRHALKLQLDYIHTWGPELSFGASDQVRLQFQLVF